MIQKLILSFLLMFSFSLNAIGYEETINFPHVSDVNSGYGEPSFFVGGDIAQGYLDNAINGYCDTLNPGNLGGYVSHTASTGPKVRALLYDGSNTWHMSQGFYFYTTSITCENGLTQGCTDPLANNYNANANESNNSCTYDTSFNIANVKDNPEIWASGKSLFTFSEELFKANFGVYNFLDNQEFNNSSTGSIYGTQVTGSGTNLINLTVDIGSGSPQLKQTMILLYDIRLILVIFLGFWLFFKFYDYITKMFLYILRAFR